MAKLSILDSMPVLGRERAFLDQVFAELHRLVTVDLEKVDRDAPGMSASDQDRLVPLKMAVPAILARVEQAHDPSGLRVQGGDVWTLVAVAEETGEGEILFDGGAVLLLGDDMINRVRKGR